MTEFGRGYREGQSDLFDYVNQTFEEWRALKIIDDRQALAFKDLIHTLDIEVNYDFRRPEDD